jgi:lia operon protein LiaF
MKTAADRPQLVFGILLVLLGSLFLLNNAGILHGFSVWQTLWGFFWLWLGGVVLGYLPAALIFERDRSTGAWPDKMGRRSVGSGRRMLGLIFVLIGAFTLIDGLGLITFSVGDVVSRLWPLILIGLGAAILAEARRASARSSEVGQPAPADQIIYDHIFGDLKLNQPGWRLRDVRATTVIGDMKIDLTKASIPDGETHIDLRAVIGDVDVWAPADVSIALDVQCVFVTININGRKQDVAFRRFVDTPVDYDLMPRRVRVRADLVFGDLNLTRAG